MAVPLDADAFWHHFLSELIRELGARGGALWWWDDVTLREGPASGLSPRGLFPALDLRREHLIDLIRQGRPQADDLTTAPGTGEDKSVVILAAPVVREGRTLGVVEIVQRAQIPLQLRAGQLQFLERFCQLQTRAIPLPICEPLPSAPAAPLPVNVPVLASVSTTDDSDDEERPALTASEIDWRAVVEFLERLELSRRVKDVAATIANEGRLLWQADRVSVAVPHGTAVRIAAVSGQDHVHQRSQLIRALRRLTKLVMATKEPFRYGGGLEEIPPSLERPLAEFAQLSGARMILILPLLTPVPDSRLTEDPADESRADRNRPVLGAVIIEQMQHSRPEPALVAHLDLVRQHLAATLQQATNLESILLLPLWLSLGRMRRWLCGRRLVWSSFGLVAAIGLITALFLVPWDFRVDAQGQLMPVLQRDVFAPWDGQVVELLVSGGERVRPGQPLIRLRNDDLQAEFVKTRSEFDEKRKLIVAYQAELDEAERTAQREEETRVQGRLAETRIEIDGLSQRLALLQERLHGLTVCAPIHGVVTTFQAEQRLFQRPVQRGDLLLQVMNDQGEWHLELDVPEHRLGHIQAAMAAGPAKLPITYRLLTRPEVSQPASLTEVGTRAVTSQDRGSVVELRAALEKSTLSHPSIGAQVRARISCGEKPLGYCLFGDVIEFVQKYLWW